jgi:hypothetical protein
MPANRAVSRSGSFFLGPGGNSSGTQFCDSADKLHRNGLHVCPDYASHSNLAPSAYVLTACAVHPMPKTLSNLIGSAQFCARALHQKLRNRIQLPRRTRACPCRTGLHESPGRSGCIAAVSPNWPRPPQTQSPSFKRLNPN